MTAPPRPQRLAESTADALRRGDTHAFEELYVQLRGDVYNLAARIVGDRGDAEDIAQEVFLRAFRHLPGKTEQLRPEAWVFKTTVNACYDHLRRRKTAPVELTTGREAAVTDTFEQAATAAAVEKALGRLNPRYRTALVLKDLHGLGNAEIADVMGIARSTVAVLLFRARGAFEKRYREVAPTLGAGLPVAGLAVWLPALPLPVGLAGPPAFLAPLAGPLSTLPVAAAPLAPAAATATPVAAGIAKLAGALGTKAAVVAIAATAVTGGGIAAYHTHDAAPVRGHVDAIASATAASDHDQTALHDTSRPRTHAALAAQGGHSGERGRAAADGMVREGGVRPTDAHARREAHAGDGRPSGEASHSSDGARIGTSSDGSRGEGSGERAGDERSREHGSNSTSGAGADPSGTGAGGSETGGGTAGEGATGGSQTH